MPFEFFDYDPLTGITEKLAIEDGKIHIRYEQDVEPILDYAKAIQNEGLSDAAWKKRGAALYAVIPPIVQGQMLKKGINFLDQNHIGAVLREIDTNYAHLKATSKKHAIR